MKYKYRYVLKIPAEPHHAITYGQAMHLTLQLFHQREMQGSTMRIDELLELYKQHFIPLGYDSAEHMKERYSAGEQALKHYFAVYQTMFGKPHLLEQTFQIKLDGVTLVGKIDRVDVLPDGSFAIVDYKTGAVKDQKQVNSDDQLTLYGIGAKEALNVEANELSLFFVEAGEKVTTKRTEKQYASARTKIEKRIGEMRQSDFPAKPGWPFPCSFCEYNKICPMAAKG